MIARAESGQARDNMADFDAADVARGIHELYEPLAEDNGLSLEVRAGPAWLHGNRELVSQALANLVENAIKYGQPAPALQPSNGDGVSGGGRFITILSSDGRSSYPKIIVDGQYSDPYWMTSPSCPNNGFFVYGLMMNPTRIAKEIDITFYILKVLSWLRVVWDLKAPAQIILRNEQRLGARVIDRAAAQLVASLNTDFIAGAIAGTLESLGSRDDRTRFRKFWREDRNGVALFSEWREMSPTP